MTGWQIAGIISPIILFVLVHLIATVWWASKMNTHLSIMQEEFKEFAIEFKSMRNVYMTKEDAARELAFCSQQGKAIWREIDALKMKVTS